MLHGRFYYSLLLLHICVCDLTVSLGRRERSVYSEVVLKLFKMCIDYNIILRSISNFVLLFLCSLCQVESYPL